jgi:hypothetical protein
MRGFEPTLPYIKKRTKDGKSKSEIIRCLKRCIFRDNYNQLSNACQSVSRKTGGRTAIIQINWPHGNFAPSWVHTKAEYI